MIWKKTWALLLSVLMLASLMAGCGGSTSSKPAAAKTLRVASGAEPETLDPRKAIGVPEGTVLHQLFEGLVSVNNKAELAPGTAEKWEVSADGKKYTFHIRSTAKWSNGDPVTAQDFEYAWKSVLNPQFGARYAMQLYVIKNAEAYNKGKVSADEVGIKVINDKTLEVTLENPTPYFLSLLTFYTYYPVHKKTVESNDKWNTDPKTIVGNGAFKILAWNHNSKIELAKNENYWQKDVVKLDKLDLYLSDNAKTVVDMFDNNQLDTSEMAPPLAELARLTKENKVKAFADASIYHYMFNVTKAPFDDVRVRKAFAFAIDRDTIINNLIKGGEKPALAWAPYGYPDAKAGDDFRKVGGDFFKNNDVETAKKLLAEAGYPDGKGFPQVTMLYNTSDTHKAIAEALQEMWKKNLGVTVTLTNQEWKVYLQARYQGDFMMARRTWVSDYQDPMTAMETMLGGNKNNNTKWANPEYDKLVNQAKATLDSATRMKLMHDAEKILMNDMPFVPIYFDTKKVLMKANVKGVIRDSLGAVYYREANIE